MSAEIDELTAEAMLSELKTKTPSQILDDMSMALLNRYGEAEGIQLRSLDQSLGIGSMNFDLNKVCKFLLDNSNLPVGAVSAFIMLRTASYTYNELEYSHKYDALIYLSGEWVSDYGGTVSNSKIIALNSNGSLNLNGLIQRENIGTNNIPGALIVKVYFGINHAYEFKMVDPFTEQPKLEINVISADNGTTKYRDTGDNIVSGSNVFDITKFQKSLNSLRNFAGVDNEIFRYRIAAEVLKVINANVPITLQKSETGKPYLPALVRINDTTIVELKLILARSNSPGEQSSILQLQTGDQSNLAYKKAEITIDRNNYSILVIKPNKEDIPAYSLACYIHDFSDEPENLTDEILMRHPAYASMSANMRTSLYDLLTYVKSGTSRPIEVSKKVKDLITKTNIKVLGTVIVTKEAGNITTIEEKLRNVKWITPVGILSEAPEELTDQISIFTLIEFVDQDNKQHFMLLNHCATTNNEIEANLIKMLSITGNAA